MTLLTNRSLALSRWQAQIERATESTAQGIDAVDAAPSMHLGIGHDALAGLHGLNVLQMFTEARTDFNAPIVLTGGDSGTWLWALAEQRHRPRLTAIDEPSAVTANSLPLYVLFAGADRATWTASIATAELQPGRTSNGTFDWQLNPLRQAAASSLWIALPFAIARAAEFRSRTISNSDTLWLQDLWLAWSGILLAVALLLAALIL